MKKLLFTALLSLLVIGVSAQKKTLKSAQKELNKKNYDGAIELATAASNDPETKDNADVYDILGQAYMYKFSDGGKTDLALAKQSYDWFQITMEKGDAKKKERVMEEAVLNPATGLRLGGGERLRYLETFVTAQGGVHFEAEEYDKAYGFYALAAQIVEDVPYEFFAGYCAQMSEMQQETLKHFERVISLDNTYENAGFAYDGVIDIYGRTKDWDNALKYIAEAKELYPENAKRYGEYEIEVLINAERLDQAIKQLQDVIDQGDATGDSYYTLAFLLWNNDQFDESLVAAEAALKLVPDHYEALYVAGIVHFNRAITQLKEANLESDNDKHQTMKAGALEEFKLAMPFMVKAVEIKDDDVDTLETLSTIYGQLGMTSESAAILKRIDELEGTE